MRATALHTSTSATPPTAHGAARVVQVAKAVGDQLRANVLRVLSRDSFGVLELGAIFDMAQPAISHHLKKLSEAGLVTKRREGTSIFYRRTATLGDALLTAIFDALDADPIPTALEQRINGVHEKRVELSRHFFAHEADALAKQTKLICAPEVYTQCVADMVAARPQLGREHALEIGPGGGALLRALAPYFTQVSGIDNTPEMLDRAAPVAAAMDNVVLTPGDFNALTDTDQYDLIVAAMVVHHLPSPAGFYYQAARLLKQGGMLVVAELCDHDQDWVRDLCGDVWLGFEPEQLRRWAEAAGLAPTEQQFLAQRNGFRVQVTAYTTALEQTNSPNGTSAAANNF